MQIETIHKDLLKELGPGEKTLSSLMKRFPNEDVGSVVGDLERLCLIDVCDGFISSTTIGIIVSSCPSLELSDEVKSMIEKKTNSENSIRPVRRSKPGERKKPKGDQVKRRFDLNETIMQPAKENSEPSEEVETIDSNTEVIVVKSSAPLEEVAKTVTVCPIFGRANIGFCRELCNSAEVISDGLTRCKIWEREPHEIEELKP